MTSPPVLQQNADTSNAKRAEDGERLGCVLGVVGGTLLLCPRPMSQPQQSGGSAVPEDACAPS